jgi:hypothetical protein
MERPAKARPDFPLFARANGQWAKKIQGKLHYFGAWDDPGTAEDNYHRQEPELDGNRKTKHKQSKLRREKPNKPRPDYPLYPHPSGQWACKVGRQTNYFGPWDDPEGAERAYQDYVSNESTKTVRNSKAARTEETPRKPRKTFPLWPQAPDIDRLGRRTRCRNRLLAQPAHETFADLLSIARASDGRRRSAARAAGR